jgi:hypothetical protein
MYPAGTSGSLHPIIGFCFACSGYVPSVELYPFVRDGNRYIPTVPGTSRFSLLSTTPVMCMECLCQGCDADEMVSAQSEHRRVVRGKPLSAYDVFGEVFKLKLPPASPPMDGAEAPDDMTVVWQVVSLLHAYPNGLVADDIGRLICMRSKNARSLFKWMVLAKLLRACIYEKGGKVHYLPAPFCTEWSAAVSDLNRGHNYKTGTSALPEYARPPILPEEHVYLFDHNFQMADVPILDSGEQNDSD